MKITFLKDHLEHKKGETKEVEDLAGKYFVLTGVGEESSEVMIHESSLLVTEELYSQSEEGTKGIVHRKYPQEADREIKKANKGIR